MRDQVCMGIGFALYGRDILSAMEPITLCAAGHREIWLSKASPASVFLPSGTLRL